MLLDIIRDLSYIRIIQCRIHFVEHEEGGGLVGVHCEEEGQGGHGLFATTEVLHVSETLEGRHGVVFYAGEVGFVGVFDVEVAVLRKGVLDLDRDGLVGSGGHLRLTA